MRDDRLDMLRTSSPMRLALVRALIAWLFVATPPALCFAWVMRDLGAWGTSSWLVLSAHAGLGVGAASLAEEWGARRARPRAAALIAGAASLVVLLAGLAHGLWIETLLRTGSPAQSWQALQNVVAWWGDHPGVVLALLVNATACFAACWAVPLGLVTLDRLRPGEPLVLVAWAGVLTCGLSTMVLIALSVVYSAASRLDARSGAAPSAGDP